ncbi:H(+)/Cl(-) exchange transporter ClcA [Orbus sturtevantii]|uniref:H(+)/Cl(-) exchange transporter ClcA n=1 Tax=Orbus sturtevantii TaxID=3074109 RepID=UPI00370D697A
MPKYSLKQKERTIINKIDALQNRVPFIVIFIAGMIGIVTGFVGTLFQYAVSWVSTSRIELSLSLFGDHNATYIWSFFIAALMGVFAYYLVQRFSPESSGSGIPEIEGALIDMRPVRWLHVLPVKFFGGLGALGSGMVLGREGPTVQMGANLGQLLGKLFKVENKDNKHTFLATGAAAGITTAFNAPLAGILFVIEEMREEFNYSLSSIKAIFIGVIGACVVYRLMVSTAPIFNFSIYAAVPLNSLWLYFIFGAIIAVLGAISNRSILTLRDKLKSFYQLKSYYFLLVGGLLAGTFGLLSLYFPAVAGSGFEIIPNVIDQLYGLWPLFIILVIRLIATILCFSSGAPGGIFSPTLALGAIIGVLFGLAMQSIFPAYQIELGACAIIGMAGLFSATIRAPLTGIVLIMEMTGNYLLILPLIITCLAATFVAQSLGQKPLYTAILDKLIQRDSK